MHRRIAAGLAILALVAPMMLLASPTSAKALAKPYDFNGDGYPELVVGAPGLQVGSVRDAGGVVVLPASARGLSLEERVITQSSPGVPGASEAGDQFGAVVASADFDQDGFADLAIGHPGEAVGTARGVGAVTVVYGSSRGLETKRSRRIGAPTRAADDASFGAALAVGDFDRDSFPDLAIGAPGDDPGTRNYFFQPSGTVSVLRGGRDGVSPEGRVVLRRNEHQIGGDMRFGEQLAAGDLDLDGAADLVVASGGAHDRGDDGYPGSLSYCLSRGVGPSGCKVLRRSPLFTWPGPLAVGNVVGTSRPEIVLGTPRPSHQWSSGVLIVQLESGSPLRLAGQQTLIDPGTYAEQSGTGVSVALGDLNRDGFSELVVGVQNQMDRKDKVRVAGGAASLPVSWNSAYSQDTPGVPGVAEAGDDFGSAVALLDHDRDGRLDLTVGARGENSSGAITTLRGFGSGFTTTEARTFGLGTLGYPNPRGAAFGSSLGRT